MTSNDQPVDFAEYFRSMGVSVMREPRAEFRQSAAGMHEMFVAYLLEGFTERQAMELLTAPMRPTQQ